MIGDYGIYSVTGYMIDLVSLRLKVILQERSIQKHVQSEFSSKFFFFFFVS